MLVVFSFVLCCLLIAPIYDKWQTSPTFTSINTTNYPVWNIPFPGVTVCSNNIVEEDKLENLLVSQEYDN